MIFNLLEIPAFKLLSLVGNLLHSLSPVVELKSRADIGGFFFGVAIVIQKNFYGLEPLREFFFKELEFFGSIVPSVVSCKVFGVQCEEILSWGELFDGFAALSCKFLWGNVEFIDIFLITLSPVFGLKSINHRLIGKFHHVVQLQQTVFRKFSEQNFSVIFHCQVYVLSGAIREKFSKENSFFELSFLFSESKEKIGLLLILEVVFLALNFLNLIVSQDPVGTIGAEKWVESFFVVFLLDCIFN